MLLTSEKTFKKILNIKNLIKDNLSLLILIPTILGGAIQFIQLSVISPSLIKFFSLNQLIIDGLFIIIYFSLIIVLPYFIAYKTMSFTKKLSPKKLKIIRIIFIILIIITFLFNVFFHKLFSINNIYEFLSQFISFYIYGCGFFIRSPEDLNNFSNIEEKKINQLNIYMLITILVMGLLLASLSFIKIMSFIPIDNFELLEKKYKSRGKLEILYFNDKYIFFKIKSTKESNTKIHIEKMESVL